MNEFWKATAEGVGSCYSDGRYADLILTCGGQEFKCHKIVLCTQSKFFEAACSNGFQESMTSKIDLPEDDPYLVQLMLDYLYTGRYNALNAAAWEGQEAFDSQNPKNVYKIHVLLYALADKFSMPTLRSNAARCFGMDIDLDDDGEGLLNVVPCIYDSTPESDRTLRDSAMERFSKIADIIYGGDETRAQLLELVHDIKQFGQDVLSALIKAKYALEQSDDD